MAHYKSKNLQKKKIGCGLLFEDVTQFEYMGMALKIMNGICNEVAGK